MTKRTNNIQPLETFLAQLEEGTQDIGIWVNTNNPNNDWYKGTKQEGRGGYLWVGLLTEIGCYWYSQEMLFAEVYAEILPDVDDNWDDTDYYDAYQEDKFVKYNFKIEEAMEAKRQEWARDNARYFVREGIDLIKDGVLPGEVFELD